MNQRKAVLISNPNAGGNGYRRRHNLEIVADRFEAAGIPLSVVNTSGPGDASRIAAQAVTEGTTDVIAHGGDGTINEIVQGLAGSEARLAVWSGGTANVLARELKMPRDAGGVADAILGARTIPMYLGKAIEEATGSMRYFMLMAGIGLDASVVDAVRPGLKRRFGKAAFWYSGLGHLAYWQPELFEVHVEGRSYPATFASIGKAPRYGGNLAVTPRARIDSPEFEICIINSNSRLRYLQLLTHAVRHGMEDNAVDVTFARTKRARATGIVPVQADGELIGRLPMTFEIADCSIEVIVPTIPGRSPLDGRLSK
jgi:diacylglycerol kinase (ATP)